MKILLDKNETSAAVSLSISTIVRMVQDGRFPRPINIGSRVLWRASDITQWADNLESMPPKKETRGRKRLAV